MLASWRLGRRVISRAGPSGRLASFNTSPSSLATVVHLYVQLTRIARESGVMDMALALLGPPSIDTKVELTRSSLNIVGDWKALDFCSLMPR